jgi:two-component system, sensor histidine kinase
VTNPDAGYLLTRQVEIMVRQVRRGSIIAAIAVSLLCIIVEPSVGPKLVTLWAGLIAAAIAVRATVLRRMGRRRRIEVDPVAWERALTITSAFLGLALASGALLFFPRLTFELKALLTVVFCSWAAGSIAVLPHPKSYLFYVSSYLPIVGLAWLINEPRSWIVAPLIALLLIALVALSREISALVVASATLEQDKDRLLSEKDSLLSEKDALIRDLDSARRSAEGANQSKTRFLAAASHDLRQPVQALSLLAGVLESAVRDDRAKVIAGQIVRAVDSLEELFGAVLDLSKLEAGAVTPEITAFGLVNLIGDIESEYRARIEAKRLAFIVRSRDVEVCSDHVLLERVLRNLLENALKFTEKGSISLTVEQRETRYAVSVRDTGRGIPAEEQSRIFEEFYQLQTSERYRDPGLGLGLAIVKRLAQVLGVEVTVDSAPGQGSTFSVLIPGKMISEQHQDQPKAPDKTSAKLRDRVIVLIDDDPFVLDALGLALSAWGACPIAAEDADAALQKLKALQRAPEMLLVDFQLAGGARGTDAIVRIRERYPHAHAAVMTAETDARILKEIEWPVLCKPVSHDFLGKYLVSTLAT